MNILTYSAVVVNDISDSIISSIDVWYYLSSSSTKLLGGEWTTTAPEWVDGYFYWQKTVTTYADESISETDPVCISGTSGSTGTGIESLTEEYYLSTSKEEQIGGTWSTTPPEWVYGKYMWTRTKITYKNPYSVEYTTPICDSSWEAINEIEIGARNLILNSTFANEDIHWNFNSLKKEFGIDGTYKYAKFSSTSSGDTGSNRLHTNEFSTGSGHQANKQYTLSFYAKTSVNNSKIHAGWVSGLNEFTITTTWKRYNVTYTPTRTGSLTFYIDNANVELYLSQVQLEFGNQVTDWEIAPEDLQEQIDKHTTTIKQVSLKVDANEKSITEKVWQSDITNEINNYDKSSVQTIRDQVVTVKKDITGIQNTVSDVKTEVSKKADGTKVTKLEETVSQNKQEADGFVQTVEHKFNTMTVGAVNKLRNYQTLSFDDYYIFPTSGETQENRQYVEEVEETIGDEIVKVGHISVTEESIFHFSSVLMDVGDYTFQSTMKSNVQNTEILVSGNSITLETYWSDFSYSFNISEKTLFNIILPAGEYWFYKSQLEEGSIPSTISPAPSDMEGAITDAKSEFRQLADEISGQVSDLNGQVSQLSITSEETSLRAGSSEDAINELNQITIPELQNKQAELEDAQKNTAAELVTTKESIEGRVADLENDSPKLSQVVQTADGFKYKFAELGMAEEGWEIENIHTVTEINKNGIVISDTDEAAGVSESKEGNTTVIKANEFSEYVNDGTQEGYGEQMLLINKEYVYTTRLKAKTGLDIGGSIKIVPGSYDGVKAINFISADGTS